ncbi:MAG TPA: molybdopterin-dependent oxidoreductase, partial [Candidatus Manganitrophaceae bacterium]
SFREAAALYAGAKRAVLIFGRSILRSRDGYRNALHLADLALLSGHAVKPGSGLLALAEKNNELGAAEMGGAAEYLPGLLPAKTKGHTLVEMIDAAARGEIRALYLVGEDPLRSLPQKKVKEALRNLELLICQDLFMSESAELAHIVFPAASYAEKEGRFTSQEGEIQKFYKAIEPVGLSKPDWALFSILSRKMGASAGAGVETATALLLKNPPYKNVDEIWKEITMGMPQGYPRPDEKGVTAKIASYVQKGIDRARYALPAAEGPANGHFNLQVGQVLFHSGKMSTYADGLTALLPKELLLIHPDDARRLGVEEGETVELSAGGAEPGVRVPVKFSKKIGKGTLFFPEHFGEGIRKLAPLEIDPTTGVPYGERGRVTLSKIAAAVPS